jgi:hypothetical protein
MMKILPTDGWSEDVWVWFTTNGRVAAIGVVVVLVLTLAWYAGWLQKRQRALAMLSAVNDTTFGRCVPRSRTGAWGFAVAVEPTPEPFREFNISYQPVSIFDPFDLVRILFGKRRTSLQIAGMLTHEPVAEIVWVRGQPPARALGVKPGRAPWVYARLDFADAEYATRGTNVGALRHVLQDMYARFTPALVWITVQRERRPQVRVVAERKIEARDVSPLIASVRALGRASMRE